MPRFGSKYKMFSHIIPSTELDITDLVYKGKELKHWFDFNKYWLPSCRVMVRNLSSYRQLLGNVSSVGAWPSTNVCSVWRIADFSRGGSNSIVMCATHRWASRGPRSWVATSHSADLKIQCVKFYLILILVKSEHSAYKNNKSANSQYNSSFIPKKLCIYKNIEYKRGIQNVLKKFYQLDI